MTTIAERWMEQGMEQGMAQGMEKGQALIVQRLLRQMSVEQAANTLGFSQEEIRKLAAVDTQAPVPSKHH